MKSFSRLFAGLMLMCVEGANSLDSKHDVTFTARARYADLSSGNDDGKAGSALLRLSLGSQWLDELGTFIEIDHVESTFKDQHSDGARLNGEPFIPDVEGSEINQLFASYGYGNLSLMLGRQRLEFDNHRFVGGNNFWQNEQTFDSGAIRYSLLSTSILEYAYVNNVNRIFGPDANRNLEPSDVGFDTLAGIRPTSFLGDHKHNTHLFRLELNEFDYSQLVVYAYLIDNKDQVEVSNDTFGLSYAFKFKPNNVHYRIEADAAMQNRTDSDIDTKNIPYYRLNFGLGIQSLELSAQYEVLGSKDENAFLTPLGSVHDFNGWADMFGTPPSLGLKDQLIQLKWRKAPWKFDVRVHAFKTYEDDNDLGEELNFDISYEVNKQHSLLLRFASFNASNEQDNNLADIRRIILSYTYSL